MFIGFNFINGEFYPHRSDITVRVGQFPITNNLELNETILSARRAWHYWHALPHSVRVEYLEEYLFVLYSNFDSIVDAIKYETGRSAEMVHHEFSELIKRIENMLCYTDESAGSGITAVLSSWRFSIQDSGIWHLFYQLAHGNVVIWHPSLFSSFSSQILVDLTQRTQIPAGVISLLHGDVNFSSQLLREIRVDSFIFSGANVFREMINAANSNRA